MPLWQHELKTRLAGTVAWQASWPLRPARPLTRWLGPQELNLSESTLSTPLTDAQVQNAASTVSGTVSGQQLQTYIKAAVAALTDAQVTAGTSTTAGTITPDQIARLVRSGQLTDVQMANPALTTYGQVTPKQIHDLIAESVMVSTNGMTAESGQIIVVQDGHTINLGTPPDGAHVTLFPAGVWQTLTFELVPTPNQAGAALSGRDAAHVVRTGGAWEIYSAGA